MSKNAVMNSLFVNAARRGERAVPGLTRKPAGDTVATNAALRERLSGALNDLDAAKRAGNDAMVGFAEHRLDRIVEESRAARAPAGPVEQPAKHPHPGFDGGVQRRPPPVPGVRVPSSTELLMASLVAGRAERAGREEQEPVINTNI